jgi:hypothetical protein
VNSASSRAPILFFVSATIFSAPEKQVRIKKRKNEREWGVVTGDFGILRKALQIYFL